MAQHTDAFTRNRVKGTKHCLFFLTNIPWDKFIFFLKRLIQLVLEYVDPARKKLLEQAVSDLTTDWSDNSHPVAPSWKSDKHYESGDHYEPEEKNHAGLTHLIAYTFPKVYVCAESVNKRFLRDSRNHKRNFDTEPTDAAATTYKINQRFDRSSSNNLELSLHKTYKF